MKNIPTSAEINSLFANSDPDLVWARATGIVSRISPGYDYTLVRTVFDDVLMVFRGEYPGYSSIKTLYHDLRHTLDVFLCALRLMHGVHVSGIRQSDENITLVMIATLMHDIGYVQQLGEERGTGAQYTPPMSSAASHSCAAILPNGAFHRGISHRACQTLWSPSCSAPTLR